MGDSFDPQRFRTLTWTKLKGAALARGIPAPATTGLTEAQKVAHASAVLDGLIAWHTSWGSSARTPVEFLNEDDTTVEAIALDIPLPETRINDKLLKDLKKAVTKKHVEARDAALEDTPQEFLDDSEADEDDLEKPTQSHPDGIPMTKGAGRCRDQFPLSNNGPGTGDNGVDPTEADVPEDVKSWFGTILLCIKSGDKYKAFKGKPKGLVLEYRVITGLTPESRPDAFEFEVLILSSLRRSALTFSQVGDMEEVGSWSEGFAKAIEVLGPTSSSSSLASPAAVNASTSHRQYTVVLCTSPDATKVDLGNPDLLFSLPRALTMSGRDATVMQAEEEVPEEKKDDPANKSSSGKSPSKFIDGTSALLTEQERLNECLKLRKYLSTALETFTKGHERKLEAYISPGNVNLITGQAIDARKSEAEKLDELAEAYAAPRPEQNVLGFCLPCSAEVFAKHFADHPDEEEGDLGQTKVEQLLVHGERPSDEACRHCGTTLHPNLFVPTSCNNCRTALFCDGETRFACTCCKISYTQPAGESDKKSHTPAPAAAEREFEDLVFQYIRLSGGPDSPMVGSAYNVVEGRRKMRQIVSSFFQEGRPYGLTWRMVLYGPTLTFSEFPDGRDGLVPRDFQVRSPAMVEQELAPPLDKLGEWVSKKTPLAPPWPTNNGDSLAMYGAEESLCLRAIRNMASFTTEFGKWRDVDADQTVKDLEKLTHGVRCCQPGMLEHTACLTFHTFSHRIREQVEDFGVNRLFFFEKGKFIRLFYSQSLPKIIQRVALPIEQKFLEANTTAAYTGKFNVSGTGLSREKPKKGAKGKEVSSDSPSDTKPTAGKEGPKPGVKKARGRNGFDHLPAAMLDAPIVFRAGEIQGDRIPPTKCLRSLMPCDPLGHDYCLDHLTSVSCDVGDLACSRTHSDMSIPLPPEVLRVALVRGGLKSWKITPRCMKSWMPQEHARSGMTAVELERFIVLNIDKVLEKLCYVNATKRPLHDLISGAIHMLVIPIAANDTPIHFTAKSGAEVSKVDRITLSLAPTVLDGSGWDAGDVIKLTDGVLRNRCIPKAIATQMRPNKRHVEQPGANLALEIVRQINQALLDIDISNIPPGSRAAEIYIGCSDPESDGYDEALWDIVDCRCLKRSNVMLVTEGRLTDPDSTKCFSFRLWPAGHTMVKARESWLRSQGIGGKFLKDWSWGGAAESGDMVGLLITNNCDQSSDRHAIGFEMPKKIKSWNAITDMLSKVYEFGEGKTEIRVLSRSSLDFSCEEPAAASHSYTMDDLKAARKRHLLDRDRILQGTVPQEHNPFWISEDEEDNNPSAGSKQAGHEHSADEHPGDESWSREMADLLVGNFFHSQEQLGPDLGSQESESNSDSVEDDSDDECPSLLSASESEEDEDPEDKLEDDPELEDDADPDPGVDAVHMKSDQLQKTEYLARLREYNTLPVRSSSRVLSDGPLCIECERQPSFNGKAGDFCSLICRRRHINPPGALCVNGCACTSWNGLAGEACSKTCRNNHLAPPGPPNAAQYKLIVQKCIKAILNGKLVPVDPLITTTDRMPSHEFYPQVPTNVTADETARRHSLSGHTWEFAKLYMNVMRSRYAKVDKADPAAIKDALVAASLVLHAWYDIESKEPTIPHLEDALPEGRMLAMLRQIAFGGRTGDGPAVEDIPEESMLALSKSHRDALVEEMSLGHPSTYLGPKEGYIGENLPGVETAALQILTSFLDRGIQWRSLTFSLDSEEHPNVLNDFVRRGGIIAPLTAVPKLDDRKRPRIDAATGQPKQRPIHDHTDRGSRGALNTGLWSDHAARQMGTDDESLASKAIQEENYNPGYFLGVDKLDFTDAFGSSAKHPEAIKLMACQFDSLLNINGTNTFGSKVAPGEWEVKGSAPGDMMQATPWPNPEQDGDFTTTIGRCTDDTLHILAQRGDRPTRWMEMFKKNMKICAGDAANNDEKEAEAGGMTNWQHAFGSLFNSQKRTISVALSRLCRLEDLILPYVDDRTRKFTFEEVQHTRGSCYSVFAKAPQLGEMVLPRFDAMLSDAATRYGEQVPKDFQPSPALTGETEEQGHAMLHISLEMAWRLAICGDTPGEYMYRTFEQCLSAPYRSCFPGKEKSYQRQFFESDCSGTGYAFFDYQLGIAYRHEFTSEEQAAFNDFDREDGGVVVSNGEYLPPTQCIPLTMFLHQDLTWATNRQDNLQVKSGLCGFGTNNAKSMDALSYIRGVSFISGIDIDADYVRSKDNIRTDAGSRTDLLKEWDRLIAEWEQTHGRKVEYLQVPPELTDISHWVNRDSSLSLEERASVVWNQLLVWLQWVQDNGHQDKLKVPLDTARFCIRAALEGQPIPRLPRDLDDFPEKSGPSEARQKLNPVNDTVRVRTRHSIEKAISSGRISSKKVLEEGGQPPNGDVQEAMNVIMEKQNHHRLALWEENSENTLLPNTVARREAPIIHKPFDIPIDKRIRIGEFCTGQGSVPKAFEDCGSGTLHIAAEHNIRYHRHLEKNFKHAVLVKDNSDITTSEIEKMKLEGLGGGFPCQEHSLGNRNRQGNLKSAGSGQDFENAGPIMSEPYDNKGVAFAYLECGSEIFAKTKGTSASPYQTLMAGAPGFVDGLGGKLTRADQIKSPLTDYVAPMHHERGIVILLNTRYFSEDARIILPRGTPPPNCSGLMDKPNDSHGAYVMPEEDAMDFHFKFHKDRRTQVAYVGGIDRPPPGHGEGSFPTKAWDPRNGFAVTYTGGGGKWVLREFNGRPAFVHESNSEAARLYALRGLEEEWLLPWSEFGRQVVSHAVVQSVADALAVEISKLYLAPLSMEESNKKGFLFPVSPREVFLWCTQGIYPCKGSGYTNESVGSRKAKGKSGSSSKLDKLSEEDTHSIASTNPSEITQLGSPSEDTIISGSGAPESVFPGVDDTSNESDMEPEDSEDLLQALEEVSAGTAKAPVTVTGTSSDAGASSPKSPSTGKTAMSLNAKGKSDLSSPEEAVPNPFDYAWSVEDSSFAGATSDFPPGVTATLEATIPYPMVGPALWDHLRDISLWSRHATDEWATSSCEVSLRKDVKIFATTVFEHHHITWNDGTKPIDIKGVLCERFALSDCEDRLAGFVVSRGPWPGEITVNMMNSVGPMMMFHTNTFVSIFNHPRLKYIGADEPPKVAGSKNAKGKSEDKNKKLHTLRQVKATQVSVRSENVTRRMTRSSGGAYQRGGVNPFIRYPAGMHKTSRAHKSPVVDNAMKTRIEQRIHTPVRPEAAKRKAPVIQDYISFCEQMDMEPLIDDPTTVSANDQLKRWIAYEVFEKKNKGSTAAQKKSAINRFHTENGKLEPFVYAKAACDFLRDVQSQDTPAQGKLPVPMQGIDLLVLESEFQTKDMQVKHNRAFDELVANAAAGTGGDFMLRSKEYLLQDNNVMDPAALHWKDFFPKCDHENLSGADVSKMTHGTLSLMSSKNSLLRCTRTVPLLEGIAHNAPKLLRDLYLVILARTGSPPKPEDPIFKLSNGVVYSRKQMSLRLKTLLERFGVHSSFTGSHSLRRGGASQYLAAGVPDEDIQRFGRWTSDAYKCYLIMSSDMMDKWAYKASQVQPRFEMN